MTGHQAAYDLTDAVAVVTGAASGIGAASARLLAEAGAYVICADRDRDGAERTVKDLEGRGEVLLLDVSDERAVDEAATAVVQQRGRLDIWANVAGKPIELSALVTNLTDEKYAPYATNYSGSYGMSLRFPAPPRRFEISAAYHF